MFLKQWACRQEEWDLDRGQSYIRIHSYKMEGRVSANRRRYIGRQGTGECWEVLFHLLLFLQWNRWSTENEKYVLESWGEKRHDQGVYIQVNAHGIGIVMEFLGNFKGPVCVCCQEVA